MIAAPTASTSGALVITRRFEAPRELVFRAWSNPACLERWFAPDGCTLKVRHLDVRTGGTFHLCIQTPQGYECWSVGEYREVLAPERLVHTMAVADEHGQRRDPVAAGMDPEWPAETLVTVTFEEQAGATLLTLHQTVDEALAKRTGAHPSWLQMLDRLAEELAQG